MTLHPPIFLIGYMASGKTTFGRALARELGREFIDLDFYIQQRFRSSVAEIFATRGEEEFRRMEREMLHEVGEFADVVIACGGGTPCFFDNMDYMNSRGTAVWLQAGIDRIAQRVCLSPGKRPLLASLEGEELKKKIKENLDSRIPYYSKAALTFGSEQLEDRRQIAGSVARFLAENPGL